MNEAQVRKLSRHERDFIQTCCECKEMFLAAYRKRSRSHGRLVLKAQPPCPMCEAYICDECRPVHFERNPECLALVDPAEVNYRKGVDVV